MSNKRKKVHGNSKKSKKPQHLYQIYDNREDEVYKYGISGVQLNKNGSSKRANKLNKRVGLKRYIPDVLFKNIAGRYAALVLEYNYVCGIFKGQHGKSPKGNLRPVCKN